MRLTFRVEHCGEDGERNYSATVELPDATKLEVVEAHARTVIGILAQRALDDWSDGADDDGDGDDGDAWKGKAKDKA
jgi:hypothetical protein